jgi:hypothetical protein
LWYKYLGAGQNRHGPRRSLSGRCLIASLSGKEVASKKISDKKGIPVCTAFIKTILFGFTWWLALKKDIIEK